MRSIRLASVIIGLMILTFTIRLGDLLVQVATGRTPEVVAQTALANEEGAKDKSDAKKDAKADSKDAKPDRQEIPPKSDKKQAEVKSAEPDPLLAAPFSDEEVKVLQSLSERREQLNKRERDLDQREKLLQAAEKKVDEKVVELNNLRKEIEALLDKQTKMQEERITQLVKIYENMKPKDAANIFNEMQTDVLLEIIDHMSERKVAPVLAAMSPARAREISARLSLQKALPAAASEQQAP